MNSVHILQKNAPQVNLELVVRQCHVQLGTNVARTNAQVMAVQAAEV
jgi:hypothetical protein